MQVLRESSFIVQADVPSLVLAESVADLADRLAWLADSPDNEMSDYPGPSWSIADDEARDYGD